jgi:hypothetical protein
MLMLEQPKTKKQLLTVLTGVVAVLASENGGEITMDEARMRKQFPGPNGAIRVDVSDGVIHVAVVAGKTA